MESGNSYGSAPGNVPPLSRAEPRDGGASAALHRHVKSAKLTAKRIYYYSGDLLQSRGLLVLTLIALLSVFGTRSALRQRTVLGVEGDGDDGDGPLITFELHADCIPMHVVRYARVLLFFFCFSRERGSHERHGESSGVALLCERTNLWGLSQTNSIHLLESASLARDLSRARTRDALLARAPSIHVEFDKLFKCIDAFWPAKQLHLTTDL